MFLAKIFPFLLWFKGYKGETFKLDLVAGITVAMVLIPQSMAYAQLAGLPAYYGLYAAFLPPMVAALFGSSRQLGTGPVAVVSLMSAASLEPLATAGSPEFIAYSIVLALVVGIFQFSLGVLRLGMIVNFLSHPVINGFTNAAAIIIASSQFSKFFGVYVDKAPHHYETMMRVGKAAMDYTHIPTLIYAVSAVTIMALLKKYAPKVPNVLVAVLITTVISYFTGFNNDATVDVSTLKVPGIAEQIIEFNAATDMIEQHGGNRAKLGKVIDNLKAAESAGHGGSSIELLKLESEVKILTSHMDHAKEEAHLLRKALREMKFEAVVDGDTYSFYPKDNLPAGIATDGKTWRLKVKNKPLYPTKETVKDESTGKDITLGLTMIGGGAIVGKIPKGLPEFKAPDLTLKTFLKLLPTAIIISLLGFMEAIAIAKAMAAQTGQKIDANQELIGQGLGNIFGSFGGSYSVSGSFSRSAVNLAAGAVTGVSSVVTSAMVVITLLFFTPLLYHLPQATLAAVIMMAVIGLVNVKGFVHSWHAQKYDGIISVLSFLVTLYFAPHLDKGIMVGFVLSMGVFLYKSMRPIVTELSMNVDNVLQSSTHFGLKSCKHISVVRFDGSLFFANASYLDEMVAKFRTDHPELKYILLDAQGINEMDASGEEALAMIVNRLRSAKIGFAMSGIKGQVMDVMARTHLTESIGVENIYPDNISAVKAILQKVREKGDMTEEECCKSPLVRHTPA